MPPPDLDLDFDFDAPTAAPPPAAVDLDFDFTGDVDPEPRLAAKAITRKFVDLNDRSLAAGAPLVATRGDFAPHLAGTGTRNYISQFTQSDLDLDSTLLSKEKEDSESAKLLRSNPRLLGLIQSADPETQRGALEHARVLTRLNHVPSSPKEKIAALQTATGDWLRSGVAGQIKTALGEPVQVAPDVDPGALHNLATKLIDLPKADWNQILTKDDRDLLERGGGDKFIKFARDSLRPNVLLDRKSKLIGQSLRDPAAPPAPIVSHPLDPDVAPFDLNFSDLEPVSSFARSLLYAGQEQAVAQAQAYTENVGNRSLPAQALSQRFGEDTSLSGGIGAAIAAAPGELLGAADRLLLGIPSTALGGAVERVQEAASTPISGGVSLVQNLLEGRYDAETDPEAAVKTWRAMHQGWTRQLALSDPDFGKTAAAEAEFIAHSFPEMSAKERLELGAQYYGGAQSVQQLAKKAGISSPAIRAELSNLFGSAFENPVDFVDFATGAGALLHATLRRTIPKNFKDPKKGRAFTDFDHYTAESGAWQPLAPQLKAKLVDSVTAEINKIPDASAAKDFYNRFTRALRDHDAPITPELAAQVKHSLERFTAAESRNAGSKLSADAKAALRDLADPIADLNPIDQHFVLRNEEAYINPQQSALRIQRIKKWADAQIKTTDALELPRVADRSLKKMAELQNGLIESAARAAEFAHRKSRFTAVADDLVERLKKEIVEESQFADDHFHEAGRARAAWNDQLTALTRETFDIDTKGGLRQAPNPAMKSKAYARLVKALNEQDAPAIEALVRDRGAKLPGRDFILKEIDDLSTRQAAELAQERQAQLSAEGTVTPAQGAGLGTPDRNLLREQVLLDYADDIKKSFETPVETKVDPSPKPNKDLHDSLQAKILNARGDGKAARLTKEELAWLNRTNEKLGRKHLRHQYPDAVDALDSTVEKSRATLSKKQALHDAALDASKRVRDAHVDSGPLDISPALRKEMEKALEDVPALLDKPYASLAPDGSPTEISSLQALKESLDDLTREERALIAGVQRVASFEWSLLKPNQLRHELDWQDRAAVGSLDWTRASAKILEKKFGRKFTPAQRRALFEDARSDKPQTSEGLRLHQEFKIKLLAESFKIGKLTPEQFVEFVDADYAHNHFDRDLNRDLAVAYASRPPRLPPGYTVFRLDFDVFKHKIPDKGNFYAAHRSPDGKVTFKEGFDTAEAASQWVADNLPEGSEAAIHKTWSVIDKEIAGLVQDIGVSNLSLAEKLSISNHNHRISHALAATPHVRRMTDLTDGTFAGDDNSVWRDKDGNTFIRWTGSGNPILKDRFVSVDAYQWLEEFKSGYGLFKEATLGIADVAKPANSLIDPVYRPHIAVNKALGGGAVGRTLHRLAQTFSTVRIALNVATMLKGLLDNTFSSKRAGLNMFNPVEFYRGSANIAKGYKSYFSENILDDPYWRDLSEFNIIKLADGDDWRRAEGKKNSNIVERAIEKNTRTAEGVQVKLDGAERALTDALARNDLDQAAKLRAHIGKLQTDLSDLARPAMRSLFGAFGNMTKSVVNSLWEATEGRGVAHRGVWQAYSHLSGDIIMKYATYRHLRETLGVSKEAALHRIADHMQQLHRVPSSVSSVGRRPHGAMYTAFPADQIRRVRNAVMDPAARKDMFSTALALAGWNHVTLASQGIDTEEFLEVQAMRNGQKRSVLTDALQMLGTAHIPLGGGDVYGMSTGPALWDSFNPQSPLARGLMDMVDGTVEDADLRAGFGAGVGVASKLVGADLLVGPLTTAINKRDERGDPVESIGDYMRYLGRQFLVPKGTPFLSRESDRAWRALNDKEVNLKTGRPVSFGAVLAETLLGTRPEMSSPLRFQTAQAAYLRAQDNGAQFLRDEKEDAMMASIVARNATNPDGSYNEEAAEVAVRSYLASHPDIQTIPGGDKVFHQRDEMDVRHYLSELSKPPTVRSFRRLPLRNQVAIYANWLAVDPLARERDADWHEKIWSGMTDKLDRAMPLADAIEVREHIDAAVSSGRLRSDAVDDLRTIMSLIKIRQSR